jgi:cytoskeletal protein CcmA (bactofilin family)
MLEIKRKPNQLQSPRGGTTAALLGYTQTKSLVRPSTPPVAPLIEHVTPLVDRSNDAVPTLAPVPSDRSYQTKTPVVIGEINYKGTLPIDGILVGQLGANGGSLSVRQKTASFFASAPELSGEISFRDMLRVHGHIAGTVYSKSGTLIVDNSATVDANVEVAVAIVHGTVHGDIVARERVEVGPSARIYGNIWTRSIAIKDGAVFDGLCTMIEEKRA